MKIGHIGEGYEILMTRWFNETNICNHEAYYEDMSLHVDFYDKWIDMNFDAVCQYSLRAIRANESVTNDPAWAWHPLLIDYVPSWLTPGASHPSKFDLWANVTYQSHNAGDPSFGLEVPYDAGVTYFNLTDYQKFVIKIPTGNNNIGFYGNTTGYEGGVSTDAIKKILRGTLPYDKWPTGDGSNYDYTDYWPVMCNGSMSLGWYGNWTGAPYLDTPSYFDSGTNTLTLQGPMNFENAHHPNGALYMGAPWIEFNLTPVLGTTSMPNLAGQAPPTELPAEQAATTLTAEMVSMACIVGALLVFVAAIAVSARRKY